MHKTTIYLAEDDKVKLAEIQRRSGMTRQSDAVRYAIRNCKPPKPLKK